MTAKLVVASLLVLAVAMAWVRLMLWQRFAGDVPSRWWRVAALLVLQPICAALLHLCLFPPARSIPAGVLVVATADTPRNIGLTAGTHVVALPEAPKIADAEPVPDLGTALRRYPGIGRIIVRGAGLTPRDIDAARGLAVSYDPLLPARGLVALDPPARVAPGARFVVGGQVNAVRGASVDLIDPAGRVTDSVRVDGQGHFVLSGTARAVGPVTFSVRVRDANRLPVEQADVPVLVNADIPPRMLIMAGAPGPEVKYLRRWAGDAGFAVTTRMSAGGGIELGDAPIAIDGASLRRFDVAIIDDRSWAGLGGQRGAVMGAVRDGMGLILRASGPLDGATRGQWQLLGFALSGSNSLLPLALPPAGDPTLARTRQGIGSKDVPADLNIGDDALPEISRLALSPGGRVTVPLLRDAGGAPLAAWRAVGLGRVALWTGIDSFGLVLTGRGGLYGDWWSSMVSTVARPAAGVTPAFAGISWAGERLSLCGLGGDAAVARPNGAIVTIRADPAAQGCGGFWPDGPGWHVLRQTSRQAWPFFVQPADVLPGVRAARNRNATLMFRASAAGRDPAVGSTEEIPGSPWIWFAAFLACVALLWWFERSRIGRASLPTT